MLKEGYITQEEHDQAVAQELVFVGVEAGSNTDPESAEDIYSWYEEQVITDVMADLQEKYGYSDKVTRQMLSSGGLRIYTCIDPEVQEKAEAVYGDEELLNYVSKSTGQRLQSAITIIDNETGDIAALVGRIGEKEINRGLNLATSAKRQPGSSIKPLSVYAPAFEMGLISPISVLDDYPHEVMGGRPWPVNVDGRYRGLVTVRQALSNSYNPVSVRVLADLVTPENSFNFVEEHFHLDLEDGVEIGGQMKSDIGVAPLSMGGLTYGVNTRDMAEAFAVFPNGGLYQKSRTYTKVTREVDGVETVLLENQPESEAVLKSETAYYVNSILREVVTRVNTSGNFDSGMAIAGKTGTTDDKYDRWFVGYTPYYTAAVWVGYKTPERIYASNNPAAVMWQKVMHLVHQSLKDKSFKQPANLVEVTVCRDSGLLPSDACALDPRGDRTVRVTLSAHDVPTTQCTAHKLVEICNASGHVANEFCAQVPGNATHKVALLDVSRAFPKNGVVVLDQAYAILTGDLPAGYYAAVSPDVDSINVECYIHSEDDLPEPEPEEDSEEDTDPSQSVIDRIRDSIANGDRTP